MSAVSAVITLQFIRYISTPFTKWKAFEMGLIDETGKKIRDAETRDEKAEFVGWKNIIRKVKMTIEKLSGGRRVAQLASFATALWLLKEEIDQGGDNGSEIINNYITEQLGAEILLEESAPKLLEPGMYTAVTDITENNLVFTVKSRMEPTEVFLGANMYTLKDMVSKKNYTIAEQDLRKLR